MAGGAIKYQLDYRGRKGAPPPRCFIVAIDPTVSVADPEGGRGLGGLTPPPPSERFFFFWLVSI